METTHLGNAQHLLSIARSVRHYEQALTKASGVSFNVFNILRVGHYEVRTHSPMLAELLNPKGSHGQGGVFLRHFCSALGVQAFDAESASVKMEHHIGPQSEEEGGRIDILIEDKAGSQIIIENKIYAGEQPNQLGRYRKYSAGAHLFFLTLFGEASQDAGLPNAPKVTNISYQSNIVAWLEACRKEAANAPTVRETITQYVHLIQQLTHQNTNTRMSHELTAAVLQNEATYLAYRALCNTEQSVQKTILAKLKRELESESNALGLTLNFPDSDLAARFDGFSFTSGALDTQKAKITFQFWQGNRAMCTFGFCRAAQHAVCPNEDRLFASFKNAFPSAKKSPEWWVGWASWDQHSQWDDTTMAAIQFGNFHVQVREIVEKMLRAFEEATREPAPSN